MPARAIIRSSPPLWLAEDAPEPAAMAGMVGSGRMRERSGCRSGHDPSFRVIAELVSPTAPKAGTGEALTLRERECLKWAAMGKSEWEVSRILGISEHTAERHLLKALRKLGAVNRVQAVAEAIRHGLIE